MVTDQKKLTLTAKKAAKDSEILSQIAGHARINHCHIFCSFWKNAKKNFHEFMDASGFSISSDFLSSLMEKYAIQNPEDCVLRLEPDEKSSFDHIMPAAFSLAEKLNHEYVGVEHVIYGCLVSNEKFADFLLKHDIDTEHLKKCLKTFIEGRHLQTHASFSQDEDEDDEDSSSSGDSLVDYCVNVNEHVLSESFPSVFPRHQEIEQIEEVLCRKTKSNCILLGDAGTGKSSIVEGLAQLIQDESYKGPLKNNCIYSLDLAKMLAGTQFRGQFEKKFKKLLEALEKEKEAILFIDEAHTIIGAGSKSGSFDLANMLKPALARGSIKCIAATTKAEYTKYIEKDPALSRRFQPITVLEPSNQEMVQMIGFSLESYEEHHKIHVPQSILHDLVRLCDIYLIGQKFPDKGFDILDRAMAHARLNSNRSKLSRTDIVEIISKVAKVSKKTVMDTLNFKFLEFEQSILSEVFGQGEAVSKVFDTLVCSKAGLKKRKKPLASFFFVGPTGVGKTFLAKKIAKQYFGNEENLLQINLAEYTDTSSISKLIGTSAGYVGFEQGGVLTRFVQKRPNSVILFDEADKCYPSVLNTLLQILDDGYATDAFGNNVDFTQTIIVLTSNRFGGKKETIGFLPDEKNKYAKSIEEYLPPEFVARVDNIIPFNELSRECIRNIFNGLIKSISSDLSVGVDIEEEAADLILKYVFNAREIESAVRKSISIPVSKHIVSNGKIKKISVKAIDKKLNLSYA